MTNRLSTGVGRLDKALGGGLLPGSLTMLIGATGVAFLSDVAIDGTYLYLVGATGSGSYECRAINLSTGSVVWSYAHGATLYSVATNGWRVFVAGAAGTGAYNIRSLQADTGDDASSSGYDDVWDETLATAVARRDCMACDGDGLYVGLPSGAALNVHQLNVSDGSREESQVWGGGDCTGIAADHGYVFACFDDGATGQVLGIRKASFTVGWVASGIGGVRRPSCVASDGLRVFVGGTASASFSTLGRLYRGNRGPVLFRKCDPDDRFKPYRLDMIPSEH